MAENEFSPSDGLPMVPRRQRLGRLLICGVALAATLAAYLGTRTPSYFRPQPKMGADPCDMGFVGVRRDYGDTLFGADGKRLGFEPAINIFRTHWTQDSLQREFIFEVPVADDSFKIAQPVEIYLNGHRGYSPSARLVHIKSQHATRLIVDAAIPRLSMRSNSTLAELKGGEPVHFVDIHVSYYAGPRPPAEIRFSGPFRQGQTIADDLGRGYGLGTTFRQIGLEGRELRLNVTSQDVNASPRPLILYLADGSSKVLRAVGQDSSRPGATLYYIAPEVSREQLVKVTYGEPYWEKVFRGIAVEYQSKGRSYATYLDAFCDRLGLHPTDRDAISQRLFQTEYEDPVEALSVLDVVRGRAVIPVCNTIRRKLRAADLRPDERDRVRRIATEWLGTELEGQGIALGLWGDWPEFVEPALRQLRWIRFDRQSDRDLADSFRFRTQPTAEELAQVAAFLTERETKTNAARADLIEFVRANTEGEAALEAFQRLAECDKPWVWATLVVPDEAFARLKNGRGLSERVTRRALALGVIAGDPEDEALMASSYSELAQWLSPEFVQKDVEQFGRVMAALARHGRPERDTATLVHYLEQQLQLWNAYKPKPGLLLRQPILLHNHVGVEKVVKCLNLWHDLNLGGLGRDLGQSCGKDLCDWRNVARTALHWARTGDDPDLLPVDWQDDAENLRIIWHNTRRPEESRIALWSRSGQTPPQRLYQGVDLAEGELLYSLYVEDAFETARLGLTVSAGIHDPAPITQTFSFEDRRLHCSDSLYPEDIASSAQGDVLHWLRHWGVCVEEADATESVLSGTRLFEAWKEIYWQPAAPGERLARTFSLGLP